MPAIHAFPQSEAADPDNVADALDTGLLHWAKGETAQALQSLRHAIALSNEAGNDLRAIALAHSVADLAQRGTPSASTLPPQGDQPAADPRRARLPDPPAPTKRPGAAAEATPTPIAAANAAGARDLPETDPNGTDETPNSVPEPLAVPKSSFGSATASSARPIPPSARPAAASSTVPQSVTVGLRGGTTTRHGSSGSQHPNNVAPEARTSQRAAAIDHRLASVRVRIDRVDPDGTIRLKLLDLAATASGEDNALLIVPQLIWQELKHSG